MELDLTKLNGQQAAEAAADPTDLLEEFSIMELEERLEFRRWCNNC